jgi:hypothetical protein
MRSDKLPRAFLLHDTINDVSELANRITELERSNDELRGALLIAGKEIRKLNFGNLDSPVLKILRRTLREARALRRKTSA